MNNSNTLVESEVLFFVQNKINSAPKNDIVEKCAKFFHLDEITAAVNTLESTFKIRLSKRHKADDLPSKLLSDIYDKMWSLDASATQIPKFVASDLSRIPQEQENSNSLATMEQLLASIHRLKSDIHYLETNMITRGDLDAALATASSISAERPSASSWPRLPAATIPTSSSTSAPIMTPTLLSAAVSPSSSSSTAAAAAAAADAAAAASAAGASSAAPPAPSPFPSLSLSTTTAAATTITTTSSSAPLRVALPSSASASQQASLPAGENGTAAVLPSATNPTLNKKQRGAFNQRRHGKLAGATSKNAKSSSIIIGQNVNAGIVSFKGVDLTAARYIGHCEVGTETKDIQQLMDQHKVDVISLEKLQTKHGNFSSFKIVVKKSQLETVMNPTTWPAGIHVGHWWAPKATPESDASAGGQNGRDE